MAQCGERFGGLQPLTATIKAKPDNTKDISSMLIGAFFEDINYAADGGLYAGLVQNRDFEYALSDKEGHDQNWNSKYAWSVDGDGLEFLIDTVAPIHVNNKNYAVLKSQEIGGTLNNSGFDGIVIKKGEKYDFSVFAKMLDGKKEN